MELDESVLTRSMVLDALKSESTFRAGVCAFNQCCRTGQA